MSSGEKQIPESTASPSNEVSNVTARIEELRAQQKPDSQSPGTGIPQIKPESGSFSTPTLIGDEGKKCGGATESAAKSMGVECEGVGGSVGGLERIRERRSPKQRTWTIDKSIESIRNHNRRIQKRFGELTDLWSEILPSELVSESRLLLLRGGILTVGVTTSAIAYELDRLLREGLESELRKRYRGTLTRIRLRIDPVDD